MTVRWTVRADGDQGAQFAPRPSPVLSTRLERVMYRFGLVAQLVRALACHARGRGFEPHPSRHRYASVAQLVEQGTENPRVVGSIPTGGTISADLAHLVERHLAKVEVAGSSPVIRSKIKIPILEVGIFVLEIGLRDCAAPKRRLAPSNKSQQSDLCVTFAKANSASVFATEQKHSA